jgi:hypothetical protein
MKSKTITARAIALGLLVSGVFAFLSVYFGNQHGLYLTATQMAVLPYIFLFFTVLLLNPLCALVRVLRPFSVAEILVVFCMGTVSAGISSFGLTSQLVPITGNLFNCHWNTEQSGWDRMVVPFMNEQFFVSEPGIQNAALRYQAASEEIRRMRRRVDLAEQWVKAREQRGANETVLAGLRESTEGTPGQRQIKTSRAEGRLRAEREAFENLGKACMAAGLSADPAFGLKADRDVLARLESELVAYKTALQGLSAKAFEKVELYRKGLPSNVRAFPGIFPTPADTHVTYAGRVTRLWYGRSALIELRRGYDLLEMPGQGNSAGSAFAAASRQLTPIISRMPAVTAGRADVESEVEQSIREQEAARTEIERLSALSRAATPNERRALERRMNRLNGRLARMDRDLADLKARRDALVNEVQSLESIAALDHEITRWEEQTKGVAIPSGLRAEVGDAIRRLATMDTTLGGFLVGYVPWKVWLKPLMFWGLLIGFTYLVLLTFNILIFRQWAHNEKLIYPLAELPEYLAGSEESADGRVPGIFRSGFFWVGAAISGGVLGWNLLCASGVVQGLKPLVLNNMWHDYIINTPLHGLLPATRSLVFFTMIGFAFLIPQKVSFSLWFFTVLYMVQLLILVGLGYGQTEDSFPMEWWYTLNFRTAEGAGALMVFSAVVLYRCRRYILSAFSAKAVCHLEREEQRELRLSSALFLLGSLGVILMLWKGFGANLYFTVFTFVVILMITIGLVRAVAEGGILGFQAWVSPFHFIRTFFGMDKAWTSPALFAPLMVYYSVLFLDIKAFIAPAMANALKIRDDLRLSRGLFHLSIVGAILVAVVVAVAAEIMFSYGMGGDKMNGWFHGNLPKGLFDQIATMSKNPPTASPTDTGWFAFGALAMAILLYLRQFLFWLPHPIGFIMLVNPIMLAYWFSILLGWLAKTLVTRYGNQDSYRKARFLFIGLIFGELILVAINMLLSYETGVRSVIDYNYNWK